MLKKTGEFHLYRDHPILSQIGRRFESLDDEHSLCVWRDHFAFAYPKLLVFSFAHICATSALFRPSPEEGASSSLEMYADDAIGTTTDGAGDFETSQDAKFYFRFFSHLTNYLTELRFRPVFVCDLRAHRYLDETLLIRSLSILKPIVQEILILASPDWRDDLLSDLPRDVYDDCISTAEEFYQHVRELLAKPTANHEIALSASVTLASLEDCFASFNLETAVTDKFVLTLNLDKATQLSFFALQQLITLIYSTSLYHGNVWRIKSATERVTKVLLLSRFTDVLSPVLDRAVPILSPPRWSPSLLDIQSRSGVYVFDRSTRGRLLDVIESFMSNLPAMYDRLAGYISTLHDPPHRSHKPFVTRSSRYKAIRSVISELTENIIRHAGSVGFFSALVKDQILQVYIGDCGIGLRQGILKNYDLSDIQDNRRAFEYLFELHRYSHKRKESVDCDPQAGFGLRDSLQNIFSCDGKFICRTYETISSYVNPVSKVSTPSKLLDSALSINGTHFMIMIPLTDLAVANSIPTGTDDFMASRL